MVRVIGGFLLAAFVLAFLGWLVTGPSREMSAALDASIRSAIRQMQSPMWTSLFLAVTKLGSTWYTAVLGSLAGIVFIFLRWFRPLVLLIVVMAGQSVLHHAAKWFFARPRPPALINYRTIESFSFPSGHTITALCLYGTIAWIVSTRLETTAAKAGIWIFTFTLVLLIALSRIYIGIHHATDVIAGLVAAAIWTAAVMSVDRRTI